MAKQLDVYRDWLGITETARPLNYYQLLRLKSFEDDAGRIRAHYRKMNAHVRKFSTGDFAKQSQDLLNDLARAMLCLTDSQRKREYDASLGRENQALGRRRTIEEILLANKVVDRDQLSKARNYANAVGLEIRDALVQQKLATADTVMLAYAEAIGLPYVELEDVGVDEQLIPQIPPTLARQQSCVPVMVDGGQLLMASPNPLIPDVEEELRLRFSMPVRTVLCTPASVNTIIAKYYPRDAAGPTPAPAKKPAPKPAPAPVAEPTAEQSDRQSLSQDQKVRRRGMVAVVAFNLGIILCMILLTLVRGGTTNLGMLDFALAVVLASIAAGGAFGIMVWKNL